MGPAYSKLDPVTIHNLTRDNNIERVIDSFSEEVRHNNLVSRILANSMDVTDRIRTIRRQIKRIKKIIKDKKSDFNVIKNKSNFFDNNDPGARPSGFGAHLVL